MNKLYTGDALQVLQFLPGRCVQTCVTSPPYFRLRDYGEPGQIGLEETPDAYVSKLVDVFRGVRRVLRDDGTLWLNLGDSYANNLGTRKPCTTARASRDYHRANNRVPAGLKPKDLIGIPWRVAFALQADGWYLRQDIVWHKPNPMPESVTDRCTKSHEYVFLLSKSRYYYFDHIAILEPAAYDGRKDTLNKGSKKYRKGVVPNQVAHTMVARATERWQRGPNGEYLRNRRSVWTVPTKPYASAHFATFPPDLVRPCVLAGAPVGGVVLDPFLGSGTTAAVALALKRRYIGIELNPRYVALARARIRASLCTPAPRRPNGRDVLRGVTAC